MVLPAQTVAINPAAASAVVLVDPSGSPVSAGTPVNLTGASQIISATPTTLNVISVAESTDAARVKIRLWDSASATSVGKSRLGTYTLAAGESREESIRKTALLGIWLEVVSGTPEGCVFIG